MFLLYKTYKINKSSGYRLFFCTATEVEIPSITRDISSCIKPLLTPTSFRQWVGLYFDDWMKKVGCLRSFLTFMVSDGM